MIMWGILKKIVKQFEGRRLKPYLCPAGIPTIADGATTYPNGKKVTLNDPLITNQEADAILDFNLDIYIKSAGKLSPILWLSGEAKHSAIADFCFNLGSTRYKASTLKKKIDNENWEAAAKELEKWVFGGGKKLPGLVARRKVEAQLLLEK